MALTTTAKAKIKEDRPICVVCVCVCVVVGPGPHPPFFKFLEFLAQPPFLLYNTLDSLVLKQYFAILQANISD
jgi:hypothetical protein